LYYVQLLKDMQVYHVKEKYNRELLYTWKKESYIRQLRKDLQEYGQKNRFDMNDPYYEYQVRNLGNIISGQQTLVIPPSEEERRLNINAKYHRFLQKNPLRRSSSTRVSKSAIISTEGSKFEDDEELDNTLPLEEASKHNYAQSATISRRKQNTKLPSIHRPATMSEIRRNKTSARSLSPSKVAVASKVPVTTSPEIFTSPSDEKIQQSPRSPGSPTKLSPNYLGSPDVLEPLLITSEALDKHTGADLVTMRSVRRPRKDPSDLNLIFETRKRIYQINKRALDYHPCQRKYKLQANIQLKQIESVNLVDNSPDDINENTQKQHDNTTIN
jgi:hypothetical protein